MSKSRIIKKACQLALKVADESVESKCLVALYQPNVPEKLRERTIQERDDCKKKL